MTDCGCKSARLERRAAIVELSRASTLTDVAQVFGLSRERVRQIVMKDAPYERRQVIKVDPIRILKAARAEGVTSLYQVGRGDEYRIAKECLQELGVWAAVSRLWAWRRNRKVAARKARLLSGLKQFHRLYGRTPNQEDMTAHTAGLASATTYVHNFGNISVAQKLAGLEPNGVGSAGHRSKAPRTHCRAGHALTEDNVYRWSNGRLCRTCVLAKKKARYQKLKQERRLASVPKNVCIHCGLAESEAGPRCGRVESGPGNSAIPSGAYIVYGVHEYTSTEK